MRSRIGKGAEDAGLSRNCRADAYNHFICLEGERTGCLFCLGEAYNKELNYCFVVAIDFGRKRVW